MSSRILRARQAVLAQPMQWKESKQGGTYEGFPPEQSPGDPSAGVKAHIASIEREGTKRAVQAHESGLREGLDRGTLQAQTQLEPVMARLARTVDELAALGPRLRREAEENVVKLAVAVARRVLHRELTIDPEALLGVVRAALEKLDAREIHCLRMHPEDAVMLRRSLDQLPLTREIEVTADRSLERGAAVFETARGALDASVETQLQEIERGFTDRVRRGN